MLAVRLALLNQRTSLAESDLMIINGTKFFSFSYRKATGGNGRRRMPMSLAISDRFASMRSVFVFKLLNL